MRDGEWKRREGPKLESVYLPGKTCLRLGSGAIGQELVGRLEGLGVGVSALRRSPSKDNKVKQYGRDERHEALEADVVIVSLPATPETKLLLDKRAFSATKQGVILVNVGRGEVIDETALYEALTSGKVSGAGLDVWWNYPKDEEGVTPAKVPLHELPQVVMSPHRAAQYEAWGLTSFRDVAKTRNAVAEGESRNEVDPATGY